MSLAAPATFRKVIASHDVRPASPYGAAITPGNNAYGSYVEVLSGATLTHDVWELLIRFHDADSSAVAMDMIAQVGVDTSGGSSYTALIDHLLCTYAGPYASGGHTGVEYRFRIHIPAGSSVAVRASANNAAPISLRCSMVVFADPDKPHALWKGTFVRTFGATVASSSGTSVTSGTTSDGTWTFLGTLADTLYDWQSGLGVNDATIATAGTYHLDVGIDTQGDAVPRVAILNQRQGFTTAEAASRSSMLASFKGVSGDKVYARLQCSGTPDSLLSMMAYGVGGAWQPSSSASCTVAGTVTIDEAPADNGKTVEVYAVDSDGIAELVTTATTAGGGGAFTVDVSEATRSYFASYVDGTDIGRSAYGTPESSTFDITIGGAGSGSGPSFPVLTNATTADLIRDRAIDVVEAIIPTYLPGSRFRRYRNEGDGDFVDWCEAFPESAFRRFQIRFDGTERTPAVSNSDHEERTVTLVLIVAYPHNARAGSKQALDRDTAIDRDYDQLNLAIGLYSRSNFQPPNPDACWFEGEAQRTAGDACDFLIVTNRFSFRRSLDG